MLGLAAYLIGGSSFILARGVYRKDQDGGGNMVTGYSKDNVPDKVYIPLYTISPEEIFKGNILLFNVNFFEKSNDIYVKLKEGKEDVLAEEMSDEESVEVEEYYYYENNDKNGERISTSPQNIGVQLSKTISKWYVSLRNIGLVMMLIVLLYVGIRMMLSTVASDKAKYKQMLMDWFIGIVLLFTIHFIMVFANVIVKNLTKVVSRTISGDTYTVMLEDKDNHMLTDGLIEQGFENSVVYSDDAKNNPTMAYKTNLMGSLRLRLQLATYGAEYIGYAICFIVLVLDTLFFILTYAKRVLYMAFLTLIAPLVAVTYPIDKINDGKAQGFNKWFREYIFNLLIQPLHLLLYFVLVTSAIELASTNLIYSLVAIGFMIPAEKLLRSFFGFEKSATAPSMASGAAVGMAMAKLIRPKEEKSGRNRNKLGVGSSDTPSNIKTSTNLDTQEEMGNVASRSVEEQSTEEDSKEDSKEDAKKEVVKQGLKKAAHNIVKETGQGVGEGLATTVELAGGIAQGDLGNENSLTALGAADGSANKLNERINPTDTHNQAHAKGDSMKQVIKKPTLKHRAMRFAEAKAKKGLAAAIQELKRAPGNVVRGMGQGVGAGLAATMGLAGGIAGGDLQKAFSSTAVGATVGSAIGKNKTNGTANMFDEGIDRLFPTDTPDQAYDKVMNSEKYKDIAQYDDMIKKENALKKIYKKEKRNPKDWERMFGKGGQPDEGDFRKLYSNGLKEINDIRATSDYVYNKNQQSVFKMSLKEGIAVATTANEMGDECTGIKATEWRKTWKKRYLDQNYEKTKAKKMADNTIHNSQDYLKIKKNFNKN